MPSIGYDDVETFLSTENTFISNHGGVVVVIADADLLPVRGYQKKGERGKTKSRALI